MNYPYLAKQTKSLNSFVSTSHSVQHNLLISLHLAPYTYAGTVGTNLLQIVNIPDKTAAESMLVLAGTIPHHSSVYLVEWRVHVEGLRRVLTCFACSYLLKCSTATYYTLATGRPSAVRAHVHNAKGRFSNNFPHKLFPLAQFFEDQMLSSSERKQKNRSTHKHRCLEILLDWFRTLSRSRDWFCTLSKSRGTCTRTLMREILAHRNWFQPNWFLQPKFRGWKRNIHPIIKF